MGMGTRGASGAPSELLAKMSHHEAMARMMGLDVMPLAPSRVAASAVGFTGGVPNAHAAASSWRTLAAAPFERPGSRDKHGAMRQAQQRASSSHRVPYI